MKIVISGAGEIGSHLAKMLRAEENVITIVDDDHDRLANLEMNLDVMTVYGVPTTISALRQAGVDKADLFIAVYPYSTQEVNLVSALIAKKLGARKVVARVNDEDYLELDNKLLFKEMGIELMFYPEKNAADEIVAFLKHHSNSDMMDFARGKLKITVFRVGEDAKMLDMKLGEFIAGINPEERRLFRILAISREEKTIIPKPDTMFLYGDTVFTISKPEVVELLFKLFGKSMLSAKNAMIMGGTSIGSIVARKLARQGMNVKIIDKDRERCIALIEKLPDSVKIINGDGRNSDTLYEEGIRDCDAFIAVTSRDENNILACVAAKKYGVPRTVAQVENIEYIKIAEELGVDRIINKKIITASRIFKFTLSDRARFVRYMPEANANVMEYTVPKGAAITKSALKDIDFPKDAIICGVVRGNDSFIAVGDTVIESYDRVAIFAMPETVKEIDRFFK